MNVDKPHFYAPPAEKELASEKRRISSFLLQATLYIDAKAHFVRLEMNLRVYTDVHASPSLSNSSESRTET